MRKGDQRQRLTMGMRASVALVGLGMMATAHAAPAVFPDVRLPGVTRGDAAVRALGEHLPAAAEFYGMTSERLAEILRKDPSSRLDARGRLFYVEPVAQIESAGAPTTSAAAPFDLSQTFLLNSRPGAQRTLYLDFNGHSISGSAWNSGAAINAQPYDTDGAPASFSATEQESIQKIWQRVAEDYAPFDVNVTTQDPGVDAIRRTSSTDLNYGSRVVITRDDFMNCGCGGIAYVGTFDYMSSSSPDYYQPAWVFFSALGNGFEKYVGEAASHEAGHNLGLSHDGTASVGYYGGSGSGETGWAPIMGVGYSQNLTQWSKGEYTGANNLQDDLSIIPTRGAPLRADDASDSTASPTSLPGTSSAGMRSVNHAGRITTRTDVDLYAFVAGTGAATFTASPAPLGPNLDVEASLLDAGGNVIATSNPPDGLPASLSANLSGGTYMLRIDGVGRGDPLTGYSDYASIGEYRIVGSYPDANAAAPVSSFTAAPSSGVSPLTAYFDGSGSTDSDDSIVSYAWNFGDGSSATGMTTSHTYTSIGTRSATLTVTDNQGLSNTSSKSITVTSPPASMFVKSITVSSSGSAKQGYQCSAAVTIQTSVNTLVSGAAVTGSWSGTVSGTQTASTSAKGVATIKSAKTASRGTCTFQVGNVSSSAYPYDPGRNLVTAASKTY